MNKFAVVIVNKNCLNFTRQCIEDLKNQSFKNFDTYLVDNHSDEIGTRSFYSNIQNFANIVYNNHNRPLSHIWNEYIKKAEYVCFLNNDVKIPKNFISDTLAIFEKEPKVGVVNHATNHPQYLKANSQKLEYQIIDSPYKQGWDLTFRQKAYTPIPKQIEFFCGDDFLYENLYKNGWKGAFALSSPMIHFQGQTRSVRRNSGKDIQEYKKLGYQHHLKIYKHYSRVKPSKNMNIIEV